jgi:V/A-type H+-transporting ATPase subunit F
MKIVGLLDKDTAMGFRLGGIKDIYIPDNNILKKWNEIIARSDIGIILINEKIAKYIENHLNDFRLRNTIPIILEIPDKTGRLINNIDYVSSLIKKAVGVDLIKNK